MSTVDLSKFKKIIDQVRKTGFDEFYQAGTVNKFHELNLICRSRKLNKQYWICKSFGEFHITYRNELDNIKVKQHRIDCKNQTEIVNFLKNVASEIEEVA